MAEESIDNCVRKLRFKHDQMTQQTLAALTGVSRQTIIAIESGRYLPSLPLAFKIARVFNRTIEQVFTFHAG